MADLMIPGRSITKVGQEELVTKQSLNGENSHNLVYVIHNAWKASLATLHLPKS